MSSRDRLIEASKQISDRITKFVDNGSEISVITHIDADGITSGSIISRALARMGARFSVRAVSEMNSAVIETMKAEARDFYIITDLGGGWASHLSKALGDRWIVIDHHEISDQEILTDDGATIFNAWKYGIDGGVDISAGGMAYLVASALGRRNKDRSK